MNNITFEEWRGKELLVDKYYHRNDMYRYAELAWNAAKTAYDCYGDMAPGKENAPLAQPLAFFPLQFYARWDA